MTVLKNKGLIEVLELISGYPEVSKKTFLINDEVEITGTLSDFKAMRKEQKDKSKVLRNLIYDCKTEINQPISSIEVYNYFRDLTNEFGTEETRITLQEMYCFRDMVLNEELGHLAKLEYIKNNWPIPTYAKTGKLGTFEFEDAEKMRNMVFPMHGLLFIEAIALLERKLTEKKPDHHTKIYPSDSHIIEDYQPKISAIYYVLAYIFDCHTNGMSLLEGNKKKLERIGNERIGPGKGNRFYKAFNEIVKKDLNSRKNLIELGGEEWREIVLGLSNSAEELEKYLQSKKL